MDLHFILMVLNLTCCSQWRDHWMQAVYFLKRPLHMQEGMRPQPLTAMTLNGP